MPQNMGSLYWQANDCWPVASWSSMDYFGRWKALMYYTKRFYAPTLVSVHPEDGKMNFYVVSDSPQTKQAELTVDLLDLDGKRLSTKRVNLTVEPLQGKSYLYIPIPELLNGADEKNVVLIADLNIGGETVSTNQYYFKPFKELAFSRPKIKTEVVPGPRGFIVTLSSDKVARAVYLSGFKDGFFADNFFDLIPGMPVKVEYRNDAKMSIDEFRNALKVRSLADAF
jgi:beta-mannosidase